jgi:hypothetical protein
VRIFQRAYPADVAGLVLVDAHLPLVVLSRGRAEEDATGEEGHRREQTELVALSRSGRQVVAERSRHHIPLQEPELVVAAIRDVLAAGALR